MNNVNEVLEKITDFLKTEAKTETIIGEQFKLGEFTCLPVINIGLGFGGGGGEGKRGTGKNAEGEGTGGGGGMGMGPVGFLVTRGDQIQFIPAKQQGGLSTVFEKLPDLLDKYMTKKKEEQN